MVYPSAQASHLSELLHLPHPFEHIVHPSPSRKLPGMHFEHVLFVHSLQWVLTVLLTQQQPQPSFMSSEQAMQLTSVSSTVGQQYPALHLVLDLLHVPASVILNGSTHYSRITVVQNNLPVSNLLNIA
uniref:Uncharacterized protein n=1 Tax=Spironucleus salmonicida TaxID=348837 RepID=V6LD26_9EUKA|eukprot:EST42395.1 Hypothetical protein SS50377_18038 [Spironucleus salmonicida]